MTKLSKRYIDPQNFGHYVNSLWSAFTLMDTKEDIRLLFKDLFTHTEYKMFAKRLEIARRLLAGENYESIIKALNVTARTITTVNNILASQGEGLRKADGKLKDLEKKHQQQREHQQSVLEHRVRRKDLAEKVLPELIKLGVGSTARAITKTIKRRSASKQLLV